MKRVKTLRVVSLTLACWGLMLIGSGAFMTTRNNVEIKNKYTLNITENKVAESKTNEIKLKDLEIEINTPLSVDIKDYLQNPEKIENSVLNSLKLDTSNIKTDEAGSYTYTVTYKKKKYNGTIKIKEKELPKVNFTLKNLTLKKDAVLDSNLSTYINEKLDEEVKNKIVLDLSNVKTNIEGTYQYTVTYGNKIYTANIEIYTPQSPTIITPNPSQNTDTAKPQEKPQDEQNQNNQQQEENTQEKEN